jgi:hypothetical protein
LNLLQRLVHEDDIEYLQADRENERRRELGDARALVNGDLVALFEEIVATEQAKRFVTRTCKVVAKRVQGCEIAVRPADAIELIEDRKVKGHEHRHRQQIPEVVDLDREHMPVVVVGPLALQPEEPDRNAYDAHGRLYKRDDITDDLVAHGVE